MFVEIDTNLPPDLPLVPISIGESKNQGQLARPKGFVLSQFIWVTKGQGVFQAIDETRILKEKQGMFTRELVSHSYRNNNSEFSTMWVTFKKGESLLDYYNINDYFFFDSPDFLSNSTARLMEFCQLSTSKTLSSAHAYKWLAELLNAIFEKPLSQSQRVTMFLEHNCHLPLTLYDIAENLETDRFSLCRFYSKETGKTVMQKLKEIRLQKAKRLLRYSIFPVEQIANMCGYESPSYFIKIFKQETKTTPLKYRLRV